MTKLALSIFFLLLLVTMVSAQTCDCTITPFKPAPPCFDICTVRLLAHSNLRDLQFAFGLKVETARRLLDWQEGREHPPQSLKEYVDAEILSIDDLKAMKKRIDAFSEPQLRYLALPSEDKERYKAGYVKDLFKTP